MATSPCLPLIPTTIPSCSPPPKLLISLPSRTAPFGLESTTREKKTKLSSSHDRKPCRAVSVACCGGGGDGSSRYPASATVGDSDPQPLSPLDLLISSVMKFLGKNVEFVFRPATPGSGTEVGIRWTIEWKGTVFPFVGENGIYFSHSCIGKTLLSCRGVKMMDLKPLTQFERSLRKKLKEVAKPVFEDHNLPAQLLLLGANKWTSFSWHLVMSLAFMAIYIAVLRRLLL